MATSVESRAERMEPVLLRAFIKLVHDELEATLLAELDKTVEKAKANIRIAVEQAIKELEPTIQLHLSSEGYRDALKVLIQVQPKGAGWNNNEGESA